jgi:hypothetical protein
MISHIPVTLTGFSLAPVSYPVPRNLNGRKSTLVALGVWTIATGRDWLVKAVKAALHREGLRRA